MTARSANVALKAGFAALLLFVAVRHDLPRFQGKAVPLRLVTYPIAALLVPLVWVLRGRPAPYPHDIDALLVAPFAIDLAGNALLWEFGEYLTFVQHSAERFTAYRDTMGDEALGLTGSVVGAVLATARRRDSSSHPAESTDRFEPHPPISSIPASTGHNDRSATTD